jgi:sugar phosphate isomerase/epimerase
MTLTGIGDEAGAPLEVQIQAVQALGWGHLEMRNVQMDGLPVMNTHDLPDDAFDRLVGRLAEAGVSVVAFGSVIGNWAHSVEEDFAVTEGEVARAIPKMQRLGTKFVRIMSYKPRVDGDGRDLPDQMESERFRRLREIKRRFDDAGLICVHENCMNYGGMSISHALRTLEAVPGLRWVFDTANPCFNEDRDRPGHRQDPWAFYQAVRPAISHVHVKDGVWNPSKKDLDYTMPGAGQGRVADILADLHRTGYDGFVSIEPHISVVFHSAGAEDGRDPGQKAREQFDTFVAYGRHLSALMKEAVAA